MFCVNFQTEIKGIHHHQKAFSFSNSATSTYLSEMQTAEQLCKQNQTERNHVSDERMSSAEQLACKLYRQAKGVTPPR